MMRRILYGGALLLTSLAFFAGQSPSVCGAPVTFRFEATVANVTGSANGLIAVALGDAIHGRLTYEPTPSGALSVQTGELGFDINGVLLSSTEYDISLHNDDFIVVGSNVVGPLDSASISCSSLGGGTECNPKHIPGAESWAWRTSINFSGTGAILDDEELTSDVSWNGFDVRELLLRFENLPGASGLTIQAQVGPLFLVPEPTTLLFGAICAMYSSLLARIRN